MKGQARVNLHVWDTCHGRCHGSSHRTCHRLSTLTHERTCIWLPKKRQNEKLDYTPSPLQAFRPKLGQCSKGREKMSIKLDMKLKSQTRLDFLYTEVTRKW